MQRLGNRKLALAQTNPLTLQQIVLVSTDMQHHVILQRQSPKELLVPLAEMEEDRDGTSHTGLGLVWKWKGRLKKKTQT